MTTPHAPNGRDGRRIALRITIIYALVSALWILLSDWVMLLIFQSPHTIRSLSIFKGWLFVLITALLLHSLIKRSVEALRCSQVTLVDSERRLADIISFLPDATIVIDRDGRVIAWNRAMEELTGVSAEQMLGKDDFQYAIPFYGSRHPMLVDLVLNPELEIGENYEITRQENHTLVAELFLPAFRPGGIYIWAKASPLYDSNGELIGAVEALRDITERKAAEEERLRTQERERQIEARAEEAKRQFYQRTIFSVTDGKLNLVDHAQIEAMMARPEGVYELDGGQSLTRARSAVHQLASRSGMGTERVDGLTTAFGEAAANAVKHAGGGIVKLRSHNGKIQVAVLDKGPGMDQLLLPKSTLLARFSTKASMGLGYSLILGLVDTVYLATDPAGTSILMEQSITEPRNEISLEVLRDTW